MAAGKPYFAWVDASETTFGSEHLRWDEQVFSFELKQEEGDPASLTATVRRPVNEAGAMVGLLGPGRKIWVWFALDCGPALLRFRGRLVGIPTNIFEELITLEFVARPVDVVAQKEALANTLRVLPYYDEEVIDEQRRKDPDVVLEGYTKIWHYDRETHVITVSDEITGEDGLVDFDGVTETGKVLYDGLGLTLTSGPLVRVDVDAEYTWTQQGRGSVDLTRYLVSNWPGNFDGTIQLNAGDWPKRKSGLGDGWEVEDSSAFDLYDFAVHTTTFSEQFISKDEDGGSSTSMTRSTQGVTGPAFGFGPNVVVWDGSSTFNDDGDVMSISRSMNQTASLLGMQAIRPTLVAGYSAERQCIEKVSFTLVADVQSILTDPEDGEALRLDDIRSVNLTESGAIGDPRRRSYIATERGNRSLEHLIVFARAHLMKRARVVQIAFAPKLARMPEITLRKNAFLTEPRIGEALGKIIGYSVALDGNDGRINCEVRIGCTIGRGGSATATDGVPTYCSIDYVGFDYQQFAGRTVLLDVEASVGYQPPLADPNDDGLDLLSALTAEDVIESPLVVEFGPDPEDVDQPPWVGSVGEQARDARGIYVVNQLDVHQVRAKFKLVSMTRDFETEYQIDVTDLKIPTGYDMEAA